MPMYIKTKNVKKNKRNLNEIHIYESECAYPRIFSHFNCDKLVYVLKCIINPFVKWVGSPCFCQQMLRYSNPETSIIYILMCPVHCIQHILTTHTSPALLGGIYGLDLTGLKINFKKIMEINQLHRTWNQKHRTQQKKFLFGKDEFPVSDPVETHFTQSQWKDILIRRWINKFRKCHIILKKYLEKISFKKKISQTPTNYSMIKENRGHMWT